MGRSTYGVCSHPSSQNGPRDSPSTVLPGNAVITVPIRRDSVPGGPRRALGTHYGRGIYFRRLLRIVCPAPPPLQRRGSAKGRPRTSNDSLPTGLASVRAAPRVGARRDGDLTGAEGKQCPGSLPGYGSSRGRLRGFSMATSYRDRGIRFRPPPSMVRQSFAALEDRAHYRLRAGPALRPRQSRGTGAALPSFYQPVR